MHGVPDHHHTTCVREQLNALLTVLVLAKNIWCNKIGVSNVDGLVIVHTLIGRLAVDFYMDCNYSPPFGNVIRQCVSQERLKKNCHTRWFL